MKNNRMSDFKMIPDEDELASSQRDLRFYPAEPANAKTLSSADVAEFNTAGYIRPISIFNDEEMTDIRAYFDALLEKVIAEGGDSFFGGGLPEHCLAKVAGQHGNCAENYRGYGK